jgi:hypothetical protein
MSEVQRAVRAVLVALLVAAGVLVLENRNIADPDLRYPIVLLSKVLGAIIVVILVVRVPLLIVKRKVLAIAPHAEGGLRNLGTMLLTTTASFGTCAFGVSLMIDKTGSIEYWPLSIVLIFGGLAAYGIRYLWREWQLYRRLSGKR